MMALVEVLVPVLVELAFSFSQEYQAKIMRTDTVFLLVFPLVFSLAFLLVVALVVALVEVLVAALVEALAFGLF